MVLRRYEGSGEAEVSKSDTGKRGFETESGKSDSGVSWPSWSPDTPQVQGRKTERQVASREGARLHPNSGAGRIKRDCSDQNRLYEIKEAAKTHTLNGTDLRLLWKQAVEQGKDPVYLVVFNEAGIIARISLELG